MRTPKPGSWLRAMKTIKVRDKARSPVIERGKAYRVLSAQEGCCSPVVDIGYHHHTALRRKCIQCGALSREKAPMIPLHFFRPARKQEDALSLTLSLMEEDFMLIDA